MADDSATIDFYFDIGSPYSYLASTQVDDLEGETGLAVDWRPFLLGGVFKETGNEPPARVPAKAQYMRRDLNRWADHYGVDFQLPPNFPVNTLTTQRVLTAARRADGSEVAPLADALFSALWTEGRDVSEPDVVADIIDGIGRDGASLVDRHDAPEVKQALHEVTDTAVERGAFGAPTFFVDDKMFWGNDRLHFVKSVAEGVTDT